MNSTQPSKTNFLAITAADFIVRAAYQMGKTPLLPIFAASLGATDALLGVIVSVSTVTGMVLKPGIGLLSDKWGRRIWLFVGTLFFAGVPFLYRFVETPMHLFAIRLIHGTATAIYGPVTIAYVAEQAKQNKAERIGWFGAARSGGYIVGPLVAGWLLLWFSPMDVFTAIGVISLLAFIPLMLLSPSEDGPTKSDDRRRGGTKEAARQKPLPSQFFSQFRLKQLLVSIRPSTAMGYSTGDLRKPSQWYSAFDAIRTTNAIWISGGLEGFTYVTLYALRAFLPIYALAAEINVVWVGGFFSVQEITYMICRPAGGRLGDKVGFRPALLLGMGVLGGTLILLSVVSAALWTSVGWLMIVAILLGVSQALIFPSTVALAATQIDEQFLGAGMGIVGALKNAGKIAGPVLGGLLISWLNYEAMLLFLGLLLFAGALFIWADKHKMVHDRWLSLEASSRTGSGD